MCENYSAFLTSYNETSGDGHIYKSFACLNGQPHHEIMKHNNIQSITFV